jgi:hypothetical protein
MHCDRNRQLTAFLSFVNFFIVLPREGKSIVSLAKSRIAGHGPLSPEAAIPTLFLPTVTLEFMPFGLGLASVYIVGIAAPNRIA